MTSVLKGYFMGFFSVTPSAVWTFRENFGGTFRLNFGKKVHKNQRSNMSTVRGRRTAFNSEKTHTAEMCIKVI